MEAGEVGVGMAQDPFRRGGGIGPYPAGDVDSRPGRSSTARDSGTWAGARRSRPASIRSWATAA